MLSDATQLGIEDASEHSPLVQLYCLELEAQNHMKLVAMVYRNEDNDFDDHQLDSNQSAQLLTSPEAAPNQRR
jgi:hypothetical protein